MAKDGSAPQCCSATVSSEVVVVLPWVPATATTLRPCITDSSAAERGSSRRPRRSPRRPRGCSRARPWRSRRCRRRRGWRRRGRRGSVAPRARSASSGARLLGVAAGDGDAAGEHDPRDAGKARPADADEVHGAELVAGSRVSGTGTLIGAPRCGRGAEDHLGQLVVGIERDDRVAASDIAASRSASVSRSGTVSATHSGVSAASATISPRPRPPRARVAGLLAVADRQRHKHRRQTDARDLGHRVAARPAEHGVGGGVREVHPADERNRDVRRPAERGLRSGLALGPRMCSTCTPAAAKAGAAAATDWLSRRAPCDPPVPAWLRCWCVTAASWTGRLSDTGTL